MPGFADSFWSGDYASGLGVLFEKLHQGVIENEQVLTLARLRADAEDAYSTRMADIAPTASRITGGFDRDDGASVKKAFEGVRSEMEIAGTKHAKVAADIRALVVNPFGRWCDSHAARIQNSQDDLQTRVKAHDRQDEAVKKLRTQYFNKFRLLEDLEEENKLAFQDPKVASPTSPEIPEVRLPEKEDPEEEEPLEIGDEIYQPEQVKKIIKHMLETIPMGEHKVAILGTYQNVSTGSVIVEYLQQHMGATTISYAERIGQDLVTHGFLRLVGNVGNSFANSSKMPYQWRPKCFQLTGLPDKAKQLQMTMSLASGESADSPLGNVAEVLSGWNPLNNPYPNETQGDRLRREAGEADQRYKNGVRKLDTLRCNLEEAMVDHLKYMERCELDRLKAIKAVILDFSTAISNVVPSLQSTVDKMMLFQETIQPLGDLRYLLENYQTGGFTPKVPVYHTYYNSIEDQTFGVELETRSRADKQRVPVIVSTILKYLDDHYPELEGDEARRGVWLVEVPLSATHKLRNAINTGKNIPPGVFEQFDIPVVVSVLKLYLLELPDSLVPSDNYEVIKTIYNNYDESTHVSVIRDAIDKLRLSNIATLDKITLHFTRLFELITADESFISQLAHNLAPCILRPRGERNLIMHEKHSYRLVRDLLAHRDAIFGELKLSHAASNAKRPRAISTDESKRRENMEERNKAIASRSRASSPAPPPRGHRRDRSSGGPETRFPVHASPTTASERRGIRQSLDVPGGTESTPIVENGSAQESSRLAESVQIPIETARPVGVARPPRKPVTVKGPERPIGVELVDKPMDD
ncbi:MAG: hypothetical protein M1814_003262 [Vezdaea aestivalis]|nr:MAG: hypothetical protein M1814_003262 [Vezdaea aestivalis]